MSIGSVKGFEIGDGFEAANLRGSENNDDFICVDGKVEKETNHSGGVLGGMSDGSAIVFRAAKMCIRDSPITVLHPSLQDLCNAGSCYCYLVRFPEECCLIPHHCKHTRTSYSSLHGKEEVGQDIDVYKRQATF